MKSTSFKLNSRYIVFAISFFLFGLIVFKFLHDHGLQYPHFIHDFNEIDDFEINPQTILLEIDQGKKDVFKLTIDDSEAADNHVANDSAFWLQSDYLKVATALHEHVWGETLDDWKVYSLIFHRGCQNNPSGFGSADITYYKYNPQTGGYKVHEMTMDSDRGRVRSGGTEDWPRPLFGWKSIHLNLFKFSADDVLQIAEANGGREFRAKYNNACDITLLLKPNPNNRDDWLVYYDYQGSLETFEIAINPYTGSH